VLVVSGGHPFPVEPFKQMFAKFPDMDCTFVEEKVGGEALRDIDHWPYDAIVLYNYRKSLTPKQQADFLRLMDRGVGLLVLHHAIYGYYSWPEYWKIVGMTRPLTASKENVDLKIHVADADHPITRGLKDFTIRDETYAGYGVDPKMHLLLTTDTPGNAKSIAWVHQYRNSRVCYFQLGHDDKAYADPNYAPILGRAIRWTAKKL